VSDIVTSPMSHAVAQALVHFVWQGLLIGTAGALALIALRRASPQARYGVACLTLAAMAAAPILTIVSDFSAAPPPRSSPRPNARPGRPRHPADGTRGAASDLV
jgi:hypothetical protein